MSPAVSTRGLRSQLRLPEPDAAVPAAPAAITVTPTATEAPAKAEELHGGLDGESPLVN